jgi:hypothetical protein
LPLRLKKKTSSTRHFLTAIRHQVFDWPTRILFPTRFTTASVYFRSFLKKKPVYQRICTSPATLFRDSGTVSQELCHLTLFRDFSTVNQELWEKTRHRPATLFRDSGIVNQELCHLTLFRDFSTVNQELWKKLDTLLANRQLSKAGHFLGWYPFSLSSLDDEYASQLPCDATSARRLRDPPGDCELGQ